ncbi:cytochrome c oxidase assembly factor Coa1 family protein [Aureibaculum luteum]|uniref:cytochrome c oxidase assembly factor Coa1 family protein n=1 Tax=Aureibaculum luteum TaxID=1548456 RepID=UPI003741EBC0
MQYSNDYDSIDISFRVKGSKGKGRMRIFADKYKNSWDYKEVVIGIKKLKKTIIIIERKE